MATDATETGGEFVEVAKIGRAHGIDGEVRVYTRVPDWEGFEVGTEVYLEQRSGPPRALTIERWRIANEFVIARFESIEDRNAAERLRNRLLVVPEDRLPAPDGGEVYHHDLEGREVLVLSAEGVDEEPTAIGRVAGVFETGANDVMVVDRGDEELYVPMFEGAIAEIEPGADEVYLRPLEEWAPDGNEL